MHFTQYIYPTILALLQLTEGARKHESILLSNVKTLTLRKDLKTSHNRVAPVPQLKCVGGNAKGLYEVDVLRCKNQGSDYDEENIQWTCSASLPPEFKLGSTEVICEGFASSSDPYVLKGSCGVEYRLILTAAGEERYGHKSQNPWGAERDGIGQSRWPAIIFWGLFIAVLGWMIYSAYNSRRNGIGGARGANPWGGGWGGGGGGGGGGADDPPPPYDYRPPPSTKSSTSRARPAPAGQEAWRPGFWTGVLGGGAAGYMAGNRAPQNQQPRNTGGWFGNQPADNNGGGWANYGNNNGEGSSAWGAGGRTRSSGSAGSSYSATRHESSGFGSTSRR